MNNANKVDNLDKTDSQKTQTIEKKQINNSSVSIEEIEFMIKNFPTKKTPDLGRDDFISESNQTKEQKCNSTHSSGE